MRYPIYRFVPLPHRIAIAGSLVMVLSLTTGCDRDPDLALPEPYRSLEIPAERLVSDEARVHGRELYVALCALCHGWHGDGRGTRTALSTNPRDFTDPRWRRGMTAKRAYWVIQEGRNGTAMASFAFLSSDQTWDLVAYVLSIAEKGALVEGVDADATSSPET
ncbi:MAG: cytochrome c [Thermoanaerobaculia bacterium]|nr:cytochrome c [Thermoanaerobaculia bacterium]